VLAFFRLSGLAASSITPPAGSRGASSGLTIGPVVTPASSATARGLSMFELCTLDEGVVLPADDCDPSCSCDCGCDCGDGDGEC